MDVYTQALSVFASLSAIQYGIYYGYDCCYAGLPRTNCMDAVDRYSAYYGWLLYGGTLKLQTNEIVIYIRRNTTISC